MYTKQISKYGQHHFLASQKNGYVKATIISDQSLDKNSGEVVLPFGYRIVKIGYEMPQSCPGPIFVDKGFNNNVILELSTGNGVQKRILMNRKDILEYDKMFKPLVGEQSFDIYIPEKYSEYMIVNITIDKADKK